MRTDNTLLLGSGKNVHRSAITRRPISFVTQ